MRRIVPVLSMVLSGCGGAVAAQSPGQDGPPGIENGAAADPPATAWINGAPARTEVLIGEDGQTYLGVWVDAPAAIVATGDRPPIAVSLVIDTSGSMAGEKIENAKVAAASVLESLHDGDVISVHAFSTFAAQLLAPTVVGPNTRALIHQTAAALAADGSTNMFDGIRLGQASLANAHQSIKRMILISDGHANVGPSDPASLGQLSRNGTEWGIQISAIGVGLDYDEHTLANLAIQSSGRHYHLEHPAQMAHILTQELELLAQTVATDAWIEIVPAPEVRIVDALTPGAQVDARRVRVPLGTLHAGQRREVLLRAQIPTTERGAHTLATARLSYRESEGGGRNTEQTTELAYSVTGDRARAAGSAHPEVSAMVATYEGVQAQLRAAELLNQGRNAEAAATLATAEQRMDSVAQSAPSAQRARLQDRTRAIRAVRERAAAAPEGDASAGRGAGLEASGAAMDMMGY